MNDTTKVAGLKTVKYWKNLKAKLISSPTNELWEEAFRELLLSRVTTRYFEPISAIAEISKQQGKGFAIVAIYCSLVEFFETLRKGYEFSKGNYKDMQGVIVRSKTRRDKTQYLPLSTGEIFVNFLTEAEPLNKHFSTVLANEFYINVRCAILHQAETSANWTIKDGKATDTLIYHDTSKNEIIIRWKSLEKLFENYLVTNYKTLLLNDRVTQKAFIFKWDKICQL